MYDWIINFNKNFILQRPEKIKLLTSTRRENHRLKSGFAAFQGLIIERFNCRKMCIKIGCRKSNCMKKLNIIRKISTFITIVRTLILLRLSSIPSINKEDKWILILFLSRTQILISTISNFAFSYIYVSVTENDNFTKNKFIIKYVDMDKFSQFRLLLLSQWDYLKLFVQVVRESLLNNCNSFKKAYNVTNYYAQSDIRCILEPAPVHVYFHLNLNVNFMQKPPLKYDIEIIQQ